MKYDYSIQNNFFGDKYLRDSYFSKFDEAQKNLEILEHMKINTTSKLIRSHVSRLSYKTETDSGL
jgi:hypothetical protein